jgi:hypothetical protein
MGTSKNVASPNSPPWKPALAILGRKDIPIERQIIEIWRSASAERGLMLIDDFSSAAVATACSLAARFVDVRDAVATFDSYLSRDHKAGFAAEIAKRALARAVASKQGIQGFAGELFAEATSYYASRDLPSFIGHDGRIDSPSAAIRLKASMMEQTRISVASSGVPNSSPEEWAIYVQKVISGLRGVR